MAQDYFPQCSVPTTLGFTFSVEDVHALAKQPSGASNPYGAAAFVVYNLAALGLTPYLLYNLVTLYFAVPVFSRSDRHFRLRLTSLSLMAILSFSTISYSMLSFLIASFQSYQYAHSVTLGSSYLEIIEQIGDWALHSELFTQFGWSLISTPSNAEITQSSLAITMAATLALVSLGNFYALSKAQLLAYLLLAQILPTSFALTLIFIHALLLYPNATSDAWEDFMALWVNDEPQVALMWKPIGVVWAYWEWLKYVPCSLNSEHLLAQVGAARAFLAFAWALDLELSAVALVGAGTIVLVMGLSEGGWAIMTSGGLKEANWAVKALGFDALILELVMWCGSFVLASRRYEPKGKTKNQ